MFLTSLFFIYLFFFSYFEKQGQIFYNDNERPPDGTVRYIADDDDHIPSLTVEVWGESSVFLHLSISPICVWCVCGVCMFCFLFCFVSPAFLRTIDNAYSHRLLSLQETLTFAAQMTAEPEMPQRELMVRLRVNSILNVLGIHQ